MSAPTTSTETLGWLIKLLGPEAVAQMSRPLTERETADVEAALAVHGGDPVAALGANVDEETAAYMRSLQVTS